MLFLFEYCVFLANVQSGRMGPAPGRFWTLEGHAEVKLRPVHLLRAFLLRVPESNVPGDSV